jgi:uncharacterized membrane protein YgaE (UPF0421/DUF939 family)
MIGIGTRNLKTAFAVVVCMGISKILKLEYPFFVAIAAIISMENSLANSFKAGRSRMMGTIIGAGFGLIGALIEPGNAIVCGIGIIGVIYCCNLLKWRKPVAFAGVVFMAVMVSTQGKNPFLYSMNRILDTFIGIVVAVIINYLIFPPDYFPKIKQSIPDLTFQTEQILKDLLMMKKPDIDPFKKNLNKVNGLVELTTEDTQIPFMKKKPRHHSEQLNLQKQITYFNELLLHMQIVEKMELNSDIIYSNEKKITERSNSPTSRSLPNSDPEKNIIYNYHIQKIISLYREINEFSTLPKPEN